MLSTLADFTRGQLDHIAFAIIATALVVFGDDINNMLRAVLKKQPLWLRLSAFILLCSFGYGVLSVWLTPRLEGLLRALSDWQLIAAIVLIFVVLAGIAQRQRRI